MTETTLRSPRYVLAVDASEARSSVLGTIVSRLPARTRISLFVTLDHPSDDERTLAMERLRASTSMSVRSVESEFRIEADTLYVCPTGVSLELTEGTGRAVPDAASHPLAERLGRLYASVAAAYGPRAIGLALAGTPSGALSGLEQIRGAGGLSLVQHSAGGAENGGSADVEPAASSDGGLGLREIIEALSALLETDETTSLAPAVDIERLAGILDAHVDYDLRIYRIETIQRRVHRRMAVKGIPELDAYMKYLRKEVAEQEALGQSLLIGVTDFHRDPETFEDLRTLVIDPLVASAEADEVLRVWVPGCASGEEAYSIAIELLRALDAGGRRLDIQIFATDVDARAIDHARRAVYPRSIAQRLPPAWLDRYFELEDGRGYRVRAEVRGLVSFATHDLTADPPFSNMHLVSCRNVLIYLSDTVKQEVGRLFHFALQPNGFLFLSQAESIGGQKSLFKIVSKSSRIYQKIDTGRPSSYARAPQRPVRKRESVIQFEGRTSHVPKPIDRARRTVLEAWVPPTVIVSEEGLVQFMHGDLSPYLQLPQGENPQLLLSSLLRPELASRARSALFECREKGQPKSVDLRFEGPGQHRRLRMTAKAAPAMGRRSVILSFEAVSGDETTAVTPNSTDLAVTDLERELDATREDLRSTTEQLEASNEELRSSNEESMSMNEELQSSNEELEATSEELRSLNEELTTVNSQLREKVEEVERAHDDLNNFIASSRIATIFLDPELRIKRSSPAARELLSLVHEDAGRPLGDLSSDLIRELAEESRTVLETLEAQLREIEAPGHRWFVRRALPYMSESRRIEGVVVTFTDITEQRRATEATARRERLKGVSSRLAIKALHAGALKAFLDEAVFEAQQALGCEYVEVWELLPGDERLVLRSATGWSPALIGAATISGEGGTQLGVSLRGDTVLSVDDHASETRFSASKLHREVGVASSRSLAIQNGDQTYGVLAVHAATARAFSPESVDFLEDLAQLMAALVDRLLVRLRARLELVVSSAIADASDTADGLTTIVQRMTTAVGAVVGELWVPSPSPESWLRSVVHVDPSLDRDVAEDLSRASSDGPGARISRLTLKEGRAIRWTEPSPPEPSRPETELRTVTRSWAGLGLPIRKDGDTVGIVTLLLGTGVLADPVFLSSLDRVGETIGQFIHRSELELRDRRLAAVAESSHDAIFSYDHEGTITTWLPGAVELYGFTAEEAIGSDLTLIVPREDVESLWEYNSRLGRGVPLDPLEAVRVSKSGAKIDVSVSGAYILGRDGSVVAISSTDRDLRHQKRTERSLLEADGQKNEFLAMLGHELRNPLAAIRSASELLDASSQDGETITKAKSVLERQTAHMAKLLDGLLDVSRMVHGKVELDLEEVDVAWICREVVEDAMQRSGRRILDLAIPSKPLRVRGDRVRLAEIVDNLISNAMKFTSKGRISVRLSAVGAWVEITVTDPGVGIDPSLLPRVFDVFRQSGQSIDRSLGGLGLGLAVVKSLVELHGGSVAAESEGKDRGATFRVRLPAAPSVSDPSESPEETRSLRVLIVEDDVDVGEPLRLLLKRAGHEVEIAVTGQAGVERARSLRPDAVLCDLGLPKGMSGFDVARELRASTESADFCLIAVSGYGRPEDQARALEAGFDAFLAKPVDWRSLEAKMYEVLALKKS